jgi:hypothetical protein
MTDWRSTTSPGGFNPPFHTLLPTRHRLLAKALKSHDQRTASCHICTECDGVDAPTPTASQCAKLVMLRSPGKERASMNEVTIVGVDLAKRVFQVHGAAADGAVVFRKKLTRTQFLAFLGKLPACTVAMEACATSHFWGREIAKLGHAVRLIPPIYVKPFVKRQKNDAADAEAIAEAAMRPTMRFVAVRRKSNRPGRWSFVRGICWCASGPS